MHVVWMPVLSNDNFKAAERAPILIPDARAEHYWNGDQNLGELYGRIVELPSVKEGDLLRAAVEKLTNGG